MYSVLLSKIEFGFPLIKNRLKEIVNENMKVVVIPWAFPARRGEGSGEYGETMLGGVAGCLCQAQCEAL